MENKMSLPKIVTEQVVSSKYDAAMRELFQLANQATASSKFIKNTLKNSLLHPYAHFQTSGALYIIKVADQIVAMIGIKELAGSRAEIHHLAVHPEHRRRGYATALLNLVTAQYSGMELACNAKNTNAVTLYSNHPCLELYKSDTRKICGHDFTLLHFRTKPLRIKVQTRTATLLTASFDKSKNGKDALSEESVDNRPKRNKLSG